jgi:hypothetical protein
MAHFLVNLEGCSPRMPLVWRHRGSLSMMLFVLIGIMYPGIR